MLFRRVEQCSRIFACTLCNPLDGTDALAGHDANSCLRRNASSLFHSFQLVCRFDDDVDQSDTKTLSMGMDQKANRFSSSKMGE